MKSFSVFADVLSPVRILKDAGGQLLLAALLIVLVVIITVLVLHKRKK